MVPKRAHQYVFEILNQNRTVKKGLGALFNRRSDDTPNHFEFKAVNQKDMVEW